MLSCLASELILATLCSRLSVPLVFLRQALFKCSRLNSGLEVTAEEATRPAPISIAHPCHASANPRVGTMRQSWPENRPECRSHGSGDGKCEDACDNKLLAPVHCGGLEDGDDRQSSKKPVSNGVENSLQDVGSFEATGRANALV